MPIEEFIDTRPMFDGWALSDCALSLWTTPPTIAEFGFKLLEGWGFMLEYNSRRSNRIT